MDSAGQAAVYEDRPAGAHPGGRSGRVPPGALQRDAADPQRPAGARVMTGARPQRRTP